MPLDSEKKPTLLLVDDDAIIADSLEYVLSEEYEIERASDRASSFKLMSDMSDSPALALVDLGLPPNTHRPDEGLAVIRKISQMHPSTRILVLSGQDNKKHLFQAKEDGAVDFIAKPCDIAEIKVRLKRQIIAGGGADAGHGDIEGIVGSSEEIELLRMQIRQLADSPYPVLIEGESGSGKEVAARNLHRCSSRKQEPFLTLNCAAFNGERAPLPAPPTPGTDFSKKPARGLYCLMKSRICRWTCRPSYCVYSKMVNIIDLVKPSHATLRRGFSLQPTRIYLKP
jgi:DNA-binding NtrC family response regulator